MNFTRQEITEQIDAVREKFKSPSPLKKFPGSRVTWFLKRDTRQVIPSYIISTSNREGGMFMLPDFVQHDGLTHNMGAQAWPGDVIHALTNNVNENLPFIKNCWSELHKGGTPKSRIRGGSWGDGGVLEGKTVIICAPGPSLDAVANDIAYARAQDDNLRVIVMNRAMRRLPGDYVIAVERWIPEPWRDDETLAMQKNAVLITTPQTHFVLARSWPNQENIYWGRVCLGQFDNVEITRLKMMDAMASSTAATAVRIAYEMGAKKIILAGMDFSSPMRHEPGQNIDAEQVNAGRVQALGALTHAILSGNGKAAKAVDIARQVADQEMKLIHQGWDLGIRIGRFYYDQDFADTEYVHDRRFALWQAFTAPDGTMSGTTREFAVYAEQLKCVLGCIESGSPCRVISASPSGYLDWQGVDGTKPHPPMSFKEALEWTE